MSDIRYDRIHEEIIGEIASLPLVILKNMKILLRYFPFNISISTPPLQGNTVEYDILTHPDDSYRFTIRIMPRLYHMAGFEMSTGVMINPVDPEHAAKLLRESIDE